MTREPYECPKRCGTLHAKCSGHRQTGAVCNAQPMRGTVPPRCRRHLGGGVTSKQHAADYELRRRAVKLADVAGPVIAVDVEDVLSEHLRIAAEVVRWKDVLGALVAEVTDVGYSSRSGEQTRAAVKEYGAALDRADKVLTNISKLGLEARLVALEEARAARMTAVLSIAVEVLGLSLREPEVAAAVTVGIQRTEPKALPAGGVR